MTRLIMRRGPQPGRIYDLSSDVITIGSGTRNTIVIQDNDISREHCRLVRITGDYEVQDLNSTRGTFVAGQRVKAGWMLRSGTMIELGENVTLEYEHVLEMEKVPAEPVFVSPYQPPDEAYPSLVTLTGPYSGRVHPLSTGSVRIGRELTAEISIQDPSISRLHVLLKWNGSSYDVTDIGSTNGSAVNNEPLVPNHPVTLHEGDVLHLATSVEFHYTWHPDALNQSALNRLPPSHSTRELPQLGDSKTGTLLNPRGKRQTSSLGTGLLPGALLDHVFLTYARADWQTMAAPLMAILQDAGMSVWVDQYLEPNTDDWTVAVEQALSECRLLVVVVTPESLEERHVRLAYRYFFNREKPIMPLVHVNVTDLPLELRNRRVVWYSDDTINVDELVTEIRKYAAR
jgi:pSer/pThr/pTyr-binding forkhead associated (FHA) protein